MINPTFPNQVFTQAKPVYQLATELLGNPSNFRELASLYKISPFDPQSKIDKLIKLPSVQEARKQIGVLEGQISETITSIKKVSNDVVSIDWLMN